MVAVKDYKVVHLDGFPRKARSFVEKWHYSHNTNGIMYSHVFGLYDEDRLIGVMVYGSIAMANVWKKYAEFPEDLIELRRLCCIDDTPINTESYFIGKTLKWLKTNTTYLRVISYADEFHGHSGIIYKASNFKEIGMTSKGRVIDWGGKRYHDKTIRTRYKGVLKPFAVRVKNALESGEARYLETPGKHIFMYELGMKGRGHYFYWDYEYRRRIQGSNEGLEIPRA